MMKNISILIVKPECVGLIKAIFLDLEQRGYRIIKTYKKNNFYQDVKILYCNDFSKEILEVFSCAYSKSGYGNQYYVLIVSHNKEDTIQKLTKDVGTSKGYLSVPDGSLRSKFGLRKTYLDRNVGFEVIFNGFHKVDCIEDLMFQAIALKLENIRSIIKK